MKIPLARRAIASPTTLNLSNVQQRTTLPGSLLNDAVSLWQIKAQVSQAFGLPFGILDSRQRPERISWPRMIAMHLAAELTSASTSEIGEAFKRERSSVTHACRTVRERMETDATAREQVAAIMSRIGLPPTSPVPRPS